MADRRHISPAQRRRLGHSSSLHGDVSRRNFNPTATGAGTGGSYPAPPPDEPLGSYADAPTGWGY